MQYLSQKPRVFHSNYPLHVTKHYILNIVNGGKNMIYKDLSFTQQLHCTVWSILMAAVIKGHSIG